MTELLQTLSLRERWPTQENQTSPSNMSRTYSPEMRLKSMKCGSGKRNFLNIFYRIFLTIMFRKGGYVYICGKISMAEGVENALKDVLRHIGNMDTENVDKTFEEMRKNNRYQEDIFG